MDIIIGNICSLGATISDSFSGTRKTKKEILFVQCISQIFYIISSIVLKGYSAAVQNGVAIFRNIYATSEMKSKVLEWFLILLPVGLGLYFNNLGLLGIIPIVANLEYALSLFFFAKDPTKLKVAFVINCALFCFFNFYILNFVGGISCIVISITTVISIRKELRNKEDEK